MASILLDGNYIAGTSVLEGGEGGWGHLQLVYEEDGYQAEIEVQAPWNTIAGNWVFLEARDHPTNTPSYQ